jgi:hypothetical protein
MISIAIVILFGAAAITVARPHAISEPILGANWQCSRAAFVVTCSHPTGHPLLPNLAPAPARRVPVSLRKWQDSGYLHDGDTKQAFAKRSAAA